MAVILCRSDGKPFPAPPPVEMRGLPRIIVDYEPLPDHSSYQGKQIATRTESHYACLDQPREKFFKDTYERRHEQLTEGGFHTPHNKPYKEVGNVELDDGRLILEALGQMHNEDDERLTHKSKSKKARIKNEPQPASLVSPYRVKLHSKTQSHYPTELLTLDHKIEQGQSQLQQMQQGNRLFGLIEEDKLRKRLQDEAQHQQDQNARLKDWKEAEVAPESDVVLEDSLKLNISLQRFREQFGEGRNLSSDGRNRTVSLSVTPEARRYSMVDTSLRSSIAGTDLKSRRKSVCVSKALPRVDESGEGVSREGMSREGVSRLTESRVSSRGMEILVDEFRDDQSSRPVSAAINPVSQWYRQLCVMVWILEAMQFENPLHAIPLARCWDLSRRYPDEHVGKRKYEMQKNALDRYQRELYTPARKGVFRSKIQSFLGFQRTMSLSPSKSKSSVSKESSQEHYSNPSLKTHDFYKLEEERMKKQKKLTPSQMENLRTMLDEELNYSMKQSKSRINALMRETGQAKMKKGMLKKWSFKLPSVTLDLNDLKMQFSDADEEMRMVIHEQLSAMERDREEALQQRLESLHVTGSLWQDLTNMRKGVKIESTEMARRKLLMNYHWYEELLMALPREVKEDRYCHQLLDALSVIATDMYAAGPMKMSKKKLIQVLATLKPFELQAPDISGAAKYLMKHVVYIAEEDYDKWLQQHVAVYRFNTKIAGGKS